MANSDRRFSQGASHEDPHSARATTQSADATDQAEQPAAAGAPFRYWAFISYSSLDRDTAIWLINRVEAYRIPDNLVGTNTSIGPIPKRLYPLFRDRDELRAGPDLKEALEQALRASRYLVVLCSPHAAKASSWVNEEIRYFQQLGRGHEIIPLIVSGEPNATLHGRGDLECFPPALRAADSAADHPEAQVAEPLAADLYREDANPRQSRRKALLKVIARMIDVDFDDLAQRDHKRRLQRLRRIAALSGAVVTVLVAAVTQWYWQSVENNVKTMVREAKQVQQYDPELAALLSLRAYAMDPSVAAYDGLIAVATSNPHFQSILHRGQRPEAAAIDYDDDLVAVAACVDDSCAKHALSLYRQGRTDPIGEPVVISADAVVAVAFRPDRPEVFVTAYQDHADKILKLTYGDHGWDARIDEYWAYKHQIGPIAFSRGSGRSAIVFGKWDGQFVYTKVQVRGEDDRPVCTQEAYAPIDRIAFSPDGQTLAFVSDHHVQLLDINTCKVRRPSRFTTHRSGDVGFGATSTELISVGYDGILYRLDPAGEAAHAIGAPLRFSALDYHHLLSPGARYLASREKAANLPDGYRALSRPGRRPARA